ncbi:hypothetical protein [Leisingera sp. ANG-M7]|uniref:hypothetical protein n=1 Tax=Leisingera sp. ANG-M7 TaxID=1577902 RepID=UPI00126A6A9F|nr:hypothetical protein [Leisingera sp. ANG-M7]
MNAKIFKSQKKQQEDLAELVSAAKDYAQACVTFEAASNRQEREQSLKRDSATQLVDELDAAADAVGKAQARVAILVQALVADGSLQVLGKLLASQHHFARNVPGDSSR